MKEDDNVLFSERPLRELHLFAGAGGGILGGMLLGHTCVCAVEIEPYCRQVLFQRQRDSILPKFPIWDDIKTFDGKPWRGLVDVVCGGFPCTDISCAGRKAGIEGKSSGLWKEMARIINEVRPKYAFVENSSNLIRKGLSVVLSDLTKIGYDSVWTIVGAYEAKAPHRRERTYLLAFPNSNSIGRNEQTGFSEKIQQPKEQRIQPKESKQSKLYEPLYGDCVNGWVKWWGTEPRISRVVDGVANRVDRIKAIGNGQVPQCVVLAWKILHKAVEERKSRIRSNTI